MSTQHHRHRFSRFLGPNNGIVILTLQANFVEASDPHTAECGE